MERLEGTLQRAEMGQDLGSSRGLQKQHHQLEVESQALARRMATLVSEAHQVVQASTARPQDQCLKSRKRAVLPIILMHIFSTGSCHSSCLSCKSYCIIYSFLR